MEQENALQYVSQSFEVGRHFRLHRGPVGGFEQLFDSRKVPLPQFFKYIPVMRIAFAGPGRQVNKRIRHFGKCRKNDRKPVATEVIIFQYLQEPFG